MFGSIAHRGRLAGATLFAAFSFVAVSPGGIVHAFVDGDAKRGEYISRLGGCHSCHTNPKDKDSALAGGVALKSPFGVFHAPNITPDKETGIGGWSDEDFVRAMTDGVAPDGSHYYPSFPYTSYTRMTRRDLIDLKAYLDTVRPVRKETPPHDLSFPYNIRFMLGPWKWIFLDKGEFEPKPDRSDSWNRGAYIVTGPAHCGECHTARNFFGATSDDFALGGARVGADGEPTPNITPHAKQGIGSWSSSDIEFALKSGMLPDGDFVGSSMAEMVENSSSHWTDADIRAVAEYLLSLPKRKTP